MKTKLRQLSVYDGKDVYDFLQQLPAEENGFHNSAHGLTYREFKAWLIKMDDYAHGLHMSEWMVPSSEYWFYADDVLVGNIRLRHYLNDALKKHGGHIGYAIAPAYRKKGYAKGMLRSMCEEAKKYGLTNVLLTANCDNIASRKTIVSCAGSLEKEFDGIAYYRIQLNHQ